MRAALQSKAQSQTALKAYALHHSSPKPHHPTRAIVLSISHRHLRATHHPSPYNPHSELPLRSLPHRDPRTTAFFEFTFSSYRPWSLRLQFAHTRRSATLFPRQRKCSLGPPVAFWITSIPSSRCTMSTSERCFEICQWMEALSCDSLEVTKASLASEFPRFRAGELRRK